MLRLIVRLIDRCTHLRSTVGCHNWSYTRPQDATSARTIGRRMKRLILPSVAGRHDWSYDRSPRLIVRSVVDSSGAITDRTSVVDRYHYSRTISYDGSCHRYFRIVRDSATTCISKSPYATAAGDRSKHCRSFAPWPNRNQSYDPEIVRSGVTVALVARRLYTL